MSRRASKCHVLGMSQPLQQCNHNSCIPWTGSAHLLACQQSVTGKGRCMGSYFSLENYWLLMYTYRRIVIVFSHMPTGEFSRLQWVFIHTWTQRWAQLKSMNHKIKRCHCRKRIFEEAVEFKRGWRQIRMGKEWK